MRLPILEPRLVARFRLHEQACSPAGWSRRATIAALLTLLLSEPATVHGAEAAAEATPIPPVVSLGAAATGDRLFVCGWCGEGAAGTAPPRGRGSFCTIDLGPGRRGTWEPLGGGEPVSDSVLVSHGDSVIRVGGTLVSDPGPNSEAPQPTRSVQRYDANTERWTLLPDLPSGRSGHSAAVLGNHLYVVGGRGGDGDRAWCSDMLRLDLSDPGEGWAREPQPFKRTALRAIAFDGKVFAIGGRTPRGSVTRRVFAYAPAGGWQESRPLPGNQLNGLSPAACVHEGRLLVSCRDGRLYDWAADGDLLPGAEPRWQQVGTLAVPRCGHELVATASGRLLAVGGVSNEMSVRLVEDLRIRRPGLPATPSTLDVWRLPNPSGARSGSAACFHENHVVLFGGSGLRLLADEGCEDSVCTALRVSLDGLRVTSLPDVCCPVTGAQPVVIGEEDEPLILGIGGTSAEAAGRSKLDLVAYQTHSTSWVEGEFDIPVGRRGFRTVRDTSGIWLLGGRFAAPAVNHPNHATSVLLFDPTAGGLAFRKTAWDLPRSRIAFAAEILNGQAYLVGGRDADGGFLDRCDVLDLKTGDWSQIAPLPEPRVGPSLTAWQGRLYLAGGRSPDKRGQLVPNRSVVQYDLVKRRWATTIERLPTSAEEVHLFPLPHRLLAFTVEPGESSHFQLCVVDPAAESDPPSGKPERDFAIWESD